MDAHPKIRVFKDQESLARAATLRLVELNGQSIKERKLCSFALAGGETPRAVYHLLASDEFKVRVNWKLTHVFFGDERLVPPGDPRSNFGMARQELLSRVPIPGANVHRIHGEMPPGEAVEEYREQIRKFFRDDAPRFDVVLLGLGVDGHTASLFPGSAVLDEKNMSVAAADYPSWPEFPSSPGLPSPPALPGLPGLIEGRVTLTLPVINNAREVMFLVSGQKKASVVRDVLTASRPTKTLPATLVRPEVGALLWMLDSAAASKLSKEEQSPSGTTTSARPGT